MQQIAAFKRDLYTYDTILLEFQTDDDRRCFGGHVTNPAEDPNPYESPHGLALEEAVEASPGDLPRWARRGSVTNDVLVMIAAIVWLAILSGFGATTARTAASFGQMLHGGPVAAWHWAGWCAMLVARVPGQLFGGWMLGRFLRRVSPASAAAAVVMYIALVCLLLLVRPSLGSADYVAEIGRPAYAGQLLGDFLAGLAAVFGGAWLGAKGQQAADAKRARTDAGPKVLSLTAASFCIGSEEAHEIGVLQLPLGREIYTVDGREELNVKKAFWEARGSRRLSVGDREPHEIEIRWRRFPPGSVQVIVDGEPSIKELFPDMRFLLLVLLVVPAVLLSLGTLMLLAALTLLSAF